MLENKLIAVIVELGKHVDSIEFSVPSVNHSLTVIQDNWNHLSSAERSIYQFVSSSIWNEISTSLEKSQCKLQQALLDYVNTCDGLIQKNHLFATEKILASVKSLLPFYGEMPCKFSDSLSSDAFSDYCVETVFPSKRNLIRASFEGLCDSIDIKQKQLFIFDELKKVEQELSIALYKKYYDEMASVVKGQVLAALNNINENCEDEEFASLILMIKNVSALVPPDVQLLYSAEMNHRELSYANQRKATSELIENQAAMASLKELVDLMVGTPKQQDFKLYLSKVCEKVRTAASTFLTQLESGNASAATLTSIYFSLDEWLYCINVIKNRVPYNNTTNPYSEYVSFITNFNVVKKKVPYTVNPYSEEAQIIAHFNSVFSKLKHNLAGLLTRILNSKDMLVISHEFESFCTHFEIAYDIGKDSVLFKDLDQHFPPSLLERFDDCLKKCSTELKTHSARLEKCLSNGTIEDIREQLNLSCALNPFFSTATHFCITRAGKSQGCANFNSALTSCLSYDKSKAKLEGFILQWTMDFSNGFLSHFAVTGEASPENNLPFHRDEFYSKVSHSFERLLSLRLVKHHVDITVIDTSAIESEMRDFVANQMSDIKTQAVQIIRHFPSDIHSTYIKFSSLCDHFRSISVSFKDKTIKGVAVIQREEVLMALDSFLQLFLNDFGDVSTRTDDEVVIYLLRMREMAEQIPLCEKRILEQYDRKILNPIHKKDIHRIAKIGILLSKRASDDYLAQKIIEEAVALKSHKQYDRNKRTQTISINDILKDLKTSRDTSLLLSEYDAYSADYWSRVDSGRYPLSNLQSAINELPAEATNISKGESLSSPTRIRRLIAILFAFWTLQNVVLSEFCDADSNDDGCESTLDEDDARDERLKLLQPHPAQVIALFLLFGVGSGCEFALSSDSHAFNHLIEVKTGEGKSVVLGVASCVAAILGFEVHCASYSKYLSDRDKLAFESMFSHFGVSNNIQYGTFNTLCELQINRDIPIRKKVEEVILGAKLSTEIRVKSPKPTLLLIDEVDVFFKSGFYGSSYTIVSTLRCQEISALLQYLWAKKDDPNAICFNSVSKSAQYIACLERFDNAFVTLIEEAIKNVVYDLGVFLNVTHQYELDESTQTIGYKNQDRIDTQISVGYLTLFAYFKEHDKNRVSEKKLLANLYLELKCGSFSYAEIPKQYACIMGVTGTLTCLSAGESQILHRDYAISLKSFMPSAYGMNKFVFKGDTPEYFKIASSSKFEYEIKEEIISRLNSNDGKRAVLVVFESSSVLLQFLKSEYMREVQHTTKYIIETSTDDESSKKSVVGSAATTGSITLITRSFARGTDFVCYDEQLIKHGGLHVISTIFPDDKSEEIQIQGRTARQGNSGSFSFVLRADHLSDFFGIDVEKMRHSNYLYSTVDESRSKQFDAKKNESIQACSDLLDMHRRSLDFIDALKCSDSNFLDFLIEMNKAPPMFKSLSRTIILMDSTGSMSGYLSTCQELVKVMIDRAVELLQSKGITTLIEMQFVGYRNYGSGSALLSASPWMSDPSSLKAFIGSVKSQGGEGNEAIEAAFYHVNCQSDVDQVVLIGDMPPNSQEEVVEKRGNVSSEQLCVPETYYMDELNEFVDKNIVVHAFYVGGKSAKDAFEEISSKTGGECSQLDIKSSDGAEQLTAAVTISLLRDAGGVFASELIDEYNARYRHAYRDV